KRRMLRNRWRPDRSVAFFGSSASERPHLDRIVKRPHLDRCPTGYGSLAPPRKCLVQIGGFQHPKTDYVFLGLRVRPVATAFSVVPAAKKSRFHRRILLCSSSLFTIT